MSDVPQVHWTRRGLVAPHVYVLGRRDYDDATTWVNCTTPYGIEMTCTRTLVLVTRLCCCTTCRQPPRTVWGRFKAWVTSVWAEALTILWRRSAVDERADWMHLWQRLPGGGVGEDNELYVRDEDDGEDD